MIQPSEQRPRCDCCGEFLGPEHIALKESTIAALSAALGFLLTVKGVDMDFGREAKNLLRESLRRLGAL